MRRKFPKVGDEGYVRRFGWGGVGGDSRMYEPTAGLVPAWLPGRQEDAGSSPESGAHRRVRPHVWYVSVPGGTSGCDWNNKRRCSEGLLYLLARSSHDLPACVRQYACGPRRPRSFAIRCLSSPSLSLHRALSFSDHLRSSSSLSLCPRPCCADSRVPSRRPDMVHHESALQRLG